MNLYRAKGGKNPYLEGRHQQRRRGHRRHSSSPAFLKCSTNLTVCFLIILSITYLIVLSSFFGIGKDHQRVTEESKIIEGLKGANNNNSKHFDRHPKDDDANDDDKDFDDDVHDDDDDLGGDGDVENAEDDGRPTVAVASTITGCGSDPFIDGAAVLKYSIDRHSRSATSKFKYKFYVFYHPSAKECALLLENLGYILLERPTPIKVEEIGGDGGLRERIVVNGCCGEKELIKLEAFRLIEHPIVIHLDTDVIINKPMDDVLDFMLNPQKYKNSPELLSKIPIMWPEKEIPDDISLIFTKDYNVVAPKRSDKPYQGGFFIIKPSLETYNEFVGIVLSGDYDVKKGWGKKVGPFHGGMTIQGLLPWYYEYLHKGRSVELNRCKYNNMSDKPFLERDNGTKPCRTNEEKCEDCRYASADDVVTFHFTICQKPWLCLSYKAKRPDMALCREMNRRWYMLRSELEASWGRSGTGTGSLNYDHYKGYCSSTGKRGYQSIQKPYGKPV